MRREAFTLIEIMIALAIIAALAAISIPAIYDAVMDIEEESVVESAMLGLGQFFVDARAKSVMNEKPFEFEEVDDTSLKFSYRTDTILYSLPSGMRTNLTLKMEPTVDGTFSYVLGMFLYEGKTANKYVIEDNFKLFVKLQEEDTTMGTLTINEGLPELEYRQ